MYLILKVNPGGRRRFGGGSIRAACQREQRVCAFSDRAAGTDYRLPPSAARPASEAAAAGDWSASAPPLARQNPPNSAQRERKVGWSLSLARSVACGRRRARPRRLHAICVNLITSHNMCVCREISV